jgi:hypothetical protein
VIVGGFEVGVAEITCVGLADSTGVSPEPLWLGAKNGLVQAASKIVRQQSNKAPAMNERSQSNTRNRNVLYCVLFTERRSMIHTSGIGFCISYGPTTDFKRTHS